MAKINVTVNLIPFRPPNFVLVDCEGHPPFAIADIEPEVLSALCDQFRKDIFTKAKKADPKQGESNE